MALGLLSIHIFMVEFVDIEVTDFALFEFATALVNKMVFEICSTHGYKGFAIRKNTVLYLNILAVELIVSLTLTQLIGHLTHVALNLDVAYLIHYGTLHLDSSQRIVAIATIRAFHLWLIVLLTHHIIACVHCTADWVF